MAEGWPEKIQAAQRISVYTFKGRPISRIRYGNEHGLRGSAENPCHDCAVFKGEFHVPNCDMEQCPLCGERLLSCNCYFDEDEDAE